jgi:GT2 family glycosyltransferase
VRADKSAICAVVVTWNPDDGLGERLDRFRGQVGGVVVVDNGSEPRAIAMLVEAAARLGAHVIRNDSN